jgi:hypothetical protein
MHPNMQEQLSLPNQSFHTVPDDTAAAGIKYAYQADFNNIIMAAIQDAQGDLKSLNEAQSCSDWPSWEKAMGSEIDMLRCMGTWETMPHPTGKNIVRCKWVYRIKQKVDGTIDKYKVWLVAHGFTQIYGVDYLNTFSPVAKLVSICTILAIMAQLNWEIKSFDFNGVYLNGELGEDKEIYMQEPPGYEEGKGQVK